MLETSDVPGGVVNIVTGARDALAKVLAEHDDVDAMWYFGSRRRREDGRARVGVEHEAHVVPRGTDRDWLDADDGEGREFLREATQVKNIWIPYGE